MDLLSLGCDSLDTLMLFLSHSICGHRMQQWPLGGAKEESLKPHPGASPDHRETWHLRCVYGISVRLIPVSNSGAISELPRTSSNLSLSIHNTLKISLNFFPSSKKC